MRKKTCQFDYKVNNYANEQEWQLSGAKMEKVDKNANDTTPKINWNFRVWLIRIFIHLHLFVNEDDNVDSSLALSSPALLSRCQLSRSVTRLICLLIGRDTTPALMDFVNGITPVPAEIKRGVWCLFHVYIGKDKVVRGSLLQKFFFFNLMNRDCEKWVSPLMGNIKKIAKPATNSIKQEMYVRSNSCLTKRNSWYLTWLFKLSIFVSITKRNPTRQHPSDICVECVRAV